MVLVLIIGGGLGWKINRARTQRRAVEVIEDVNGQVLYDFQYMGGKENEFSKFVKLQPNAVDLANR